MGKIRALHTGFWTDTTLAECSRDARLFFIGLWSVADDAGVFEWHNKLLKSQIFPFDEGVSVEELLKELEHNKRIVQLVYNGKTYGLILNFTKYQKPDSRYLKYTIGDYEHVKSLYHAEYSPSTRRAPSTEGEGDSDTYTPLPPTNHTAPPREGTIGIPKFDPRITEVLNGILVQLDIRQFADDDDEVHKYISRMQKLIQGRSDEEINYAFARLKEYQYFDKFRKLETLYNHFKTLL